MKKIILSGVKSIAVIFFTAMLFACENQMSTIKELTAMDTIPGEIAKDIRLIYSDSARIQMILTSPLMYQINDEKPYVEFPEGLKVESFNKENQLISELTAEYGKRYIDEKKMEVRKNVVVINYESGKKLLTEQLFWNESTHKIYNGSFVTIIENDKTIHGDSIRADQNFEHVELFNPHGTIQVKDDQK